MAGINVASQYSGDLVNYIAKKTLPLTRKQLVAYQFGDPLTLPKGMGSTYSATRYNRLPLPQYPISEGVSPDGETMTISTVTAVAQQWADSVKITDVAEMTIFHPPFQKAIELIGLQAAETFERNTMNALMAGTQVNFVNSRGSRAALTAGDVLDSTTVIRTDAALETLGAPRFMGDEQTDTKISAESGGSKASSNPRAMPHYAAIIHTLVVGDFRQNSTVVLAWTYSDINRLYNYEAGEWSGIRFCKSNMVPSFTGVANNDSGLAYAVNIGNGALPANTGYRIIVTGSDNQNQYESRIYQVSGAQNVALNGSITVTTPSTAGFTYSVYIGTSTSPTNLGVTTSGPTTGPMQGMAVQLPPATAVVITAVGNAQTPPAAPATGVTVFPTFIIGRGAYGQVMLDNIKYTYLKDADKSDVHNLLRVVGWKAMYGTLIQNQQFMARIESASAFTATFG